MFLYGEKSAEFYLEKNEMDKFFMENKQKLVQKIVSISECNITYSCYKNFVRFE